MDILIRKSSLSGKIIASPSKSHTHRAFFLASMIEGKTVVTNPLISEDTVSTLNAFKKLGAVVDLEENLKEEDLKKEDLKPEKVKTVIISGISEEKRNEFEEIEIDLKNSGTSLRFLTAASSLFNKRITLFGDDSLNLRPNLPLINALERAGADIKSTNRFGSFGYSPLVSYETGKDKISGGKIEISGDTSSQFISAILITAPFLKNDSEIHVTGNPVSVPYIRITENVIEEFLGSIINKKTITEKTINKKIITENSEKTIYYVKGKNTREKEKINSKVPIEYKVPGDFSSASYIIAGALILPKSNVVIENLYPSNQADEALISILKEIGFEIEWIRNEGIVKVSNVLNQEIKNKEVKNQIDKNLLEIDSKNFPDLVPTLALIGVFYNIKMRIYNIKHLKFKETNRIQTVVELFKKFNLNIYEENDEIFIGFKNNKKTLSTNKINNENNKNDNEVNKNDDEVLTIDAKLDHRIAMASAIAGLYHGNVILKNAEIVSVSYPNFWNDLKKLGAQFEII